MARILLIETATAQLSVAVAQAGVILASRTCDQPRMHASLTAPYVQEVLQEAGLTVHDCDAVCVDKGPGSYTGLRVGVSTAKGLCFGAGLPLIGIGSLEALVQQGRRLCNGADLQAIVPMIDARRMEVYTARFSPDGDPLTETTPLVVEAAHFSDLLAAGKDVLFIGDGALKCRDLLDAPNARFLEAFPSAEDLAPLAEKAYQQKRFEDVAYFEPFYLKNFMATVSRKKLF